MHAVRTIAAAVLLLSLGAFVLAAGETDASPLSVSYENGEAVWRVSRNGAVTLTELIGHYASHYGGTVIYHQNAVRGEVHLIPAAGGTEYRGSEIDLFFVSLLGEFRYCPVETSPGLLPIVHYPEAAGYAPIVRESELPDCNPGRWVTCVVIPEHTDHGTVGMIMRDGGGMISAPPAPKFAYDFTGRADHVANKVRAVREIDKLRRPIVRSWTLPEGADGDQVLADLQRLSGATGARMAVLPGVRKLIVSAPARELEKIDRVAAVMLD